jgi:hypothetical protein
MGARMDNFERLCLESPGGVVLLQAIETKALGSTEPTLAPIECTPQRIAAAVDWVNTVSLGTFLSTVIATVNSEVGPWTPGAAEAASTAYRQREERWPIAAAIADRFGATLSREMDPSTQQWWIPAYPQVGTAPIDRLFRDYESVYANGEFTDAGLWTVTDPPVETHDDLVDAWELYPSPISRWWVSVAMSPRVFEIRQPDDWMKLVTSYPSVVGHGRHSWELSPWRSGLVASRTRTGRNDANRHAPDLIMPNWTSVAESYDAVHLTWGGLITTDGNVCSLGPDGYTMLRYWTTERTLWLSDPLGEFRPLESPTLSGRVAGSAGIDLLSCDRRIDSDRERLRALLGREP